MDLLKKLSTKSRLIVGFGVIIISVITLNVVSLSSVKVNLKSHQKTNELNHIMKDMVKFVSVESLQQSYTTELLVVKDPVYKETLLTNIRVVSQVEEIQMVERIDSALTDFPDLRSRFETIMLVHKKYKSNRNVFLDLVGKGKMDEGENFKKTIQNPLFEEMEVGITGLEKDMIKIADNYDKQEVKLIDTIESTLAILGFCITLLTLLLAISMLRMLRRISQEMKNGITVLGTSAAEILSIVTEISTGAAETATSVSEITTTVEEVRQTAVVSNQKAHMLIDSSQRAADAVEKGRDSIHDVIESMKKIDTQMNIISNTILKLSDQNRTIGEITSSVADIADQSNLLAVNAAIEASKAGEHGRGFTVVAQEIRNLADQSKKATTQVKEILNEINKSVNQAVGVTELGNKTVEDGSKLVAQSVEVIELLAENVEETAQASIQISSSNQQQMAGMEQVVPAMENIKVASQQNLTGIKQTQTAAHELNTLGQNLKEIIEKFNL